MTNKKVHWESVYQAKSFDQVSWYQPHLEKSLELIVTAGIKKDAVIMDVGGGASTLADDLLLRGFSDISVLDLSTEALEVSKKRLGKVSEKINWVVGDILEMVLPESGIDLWHDRAVFHFLTTEQEINTYLAIMKRALKPSGLLIVGAFSSNGGPLKCSGLDVVRYSPETLSGALGSDFSLIKSIDENHRTPFNTFQKLIYCLFIRTTTDTKPSSFYPK